MDLLGMRRNIY